MKPYPLLPVANEPRPKVFTFSESCVSYGTFGGSAAERGSYRAARYLREMSDNLGTFVSMVVRWDWRDGLRVDAVRATTG